MIASKPVRLLSLAIVALVLAGVRGIVGGIGSSGDLFEGAGADSVAAGKRTPGVRRLRLGRRHGRGHHPQRPRRPSAVARHQRTRAPASGQARGVLRLLVHATPQAAPVGRHAGHARERPHAGRRRHLRALAPLRRGRWARHRTGADPVRCRRGPGQLRPGLAPRSVRAGRRPRPGARGGDVDGMSLTNTTGLMTAKGFTKGIGGLYRIGRLYRSGTGRIR